MQNLFNQTTAFDFFGMTALIILGAVFFTLYPQMKKPSHFFICALTAGVNALIDIKALLNDLAGILTMVAIFVWFLIFIFFCKKLLDS